MGNRRAVSGHDRPPLGATPDSGAAYITGQSLSGPVAGCQLKIRRRTCNNRCSPFHRSAVPREGRALPRSSGPNDPLSRENCYPAGSPGGAKPAGIGGGQLQEYPLDRKANLSSRDTKLSCWLPGWTVLPLPLTTAAGFDAEALRCSVASLSTFVRISFVVSTQSIGIESQPWVGQLSRSGPLPRIPPATWICRPVISLPQTRQ